MVFATAAGGAIVAGVAYDRQLDAGEQLRDAIVRFAAFIVACAVAGICALIFVKDVVGNPRLTGRDRARWLSGFGLFPPLVFLYWWRDVRR